jgi:hypothetical protein
MPQLVRTLVASFTVATLAACAATDPYAGESEDNLAAGPATATSGEGKADGPELRVRAGEMTMWVDRIAVAERDGDEPVAVIEGRVSRNLAEVSSWVPDDAFGQARQRTLRTFEVELRGGHEVNTLLSGLPIFVAFDVTSGSITHYEGMIRLAPRFAGFEGSGDLFIDAAIDPVHGGAAENPLRYRGRVTTAVPASDVTAEAAEEAAPALARAGDLEWTLQWDYPSLERAAIPATDPVRFTAQIDGASASKEAAVELHVVEIGLTIQDPRDVWPSAGCTDSARACVRAANQGSGELADCGAYRVVAACLREDPCEEPQPLELLPIDVSSADPAIDAYRADCSTGGTWCSLSALRGFALPECPSEPATLESIFELVRQLDQDHSTLEFSFGQVLDRASAGGTPFFATTYSDGGPGLLDAADAIASDADGAIEAWYVSQQVPCHNCTDFQDTIILYYPGTSTVVLIDGGHGYDS